jgi:hypothetical protein
MKRKNNFHVDAGLHALRHTFLTEMGENVDVFTLKRIAAIPRSPRPQNTSTPRNIKYIRHL